MPISETIKSLREKKKWSQQDLSDKSGISRPTISLFEIGRQTPSMKQLLKLAIALDADVRVFYQAMGLVLEPNAKKEFILYEVEVMINRLQEIQRQIRDL